MKIEDDGQVIVIGSGLAGLAAAIRMALKGYQVLVFEAEDHPGGKLSEFNLGGYRFDFGPSLFTLPELTDELFYLAGKDPRDYYKYQPLDISCKYFYPQGLQLNAFSHRSKFIEEVKLKMGVNGNTLVRYLDHCSKLFQVTKPVFLERSMHKPATYFSRDFINGMLAMHQFDLFETMHEANLKRLKDPRLVQLFDRMATYNGSDPYQAPGILNLISSLEHNEGAFFPEGGMYSITIALYQLARELKVTFRFNHPVDQIIIEEDKAKGVISRGKTYLAGKVISNMDIHLTYLHLLPQVKPPKNFSQLEPSSSALVFYWGMKTRQGSLDLHNIFFSKNYKEEFEHLFRKKSIYHDPTIYVNITSKMNPSDAPEGCENWFVMVNAPYLDGQPWDKLIAATRKNIVTKLSKALDTDLENLIEVEQITSPDTILSQTRSYRGSIYGSSSNNRLAAFWRHPNFSPTIKNLYFCGGSVHPGGGVPLCLLSAKQIEQLI